MKQIASAFIKAKREFAPALKCASNPHFKSKYADLAACLEAVDDALLNNGIALYQETFEDQSGVTVETVLMHESGESIRCGKLHVPASKQDPQGYGSALTYARRYSLMAACGIAPEDDDGNAASKTKKNIVPVPSHKSTQQDTFDNLDAETQNWLRDMAMEAISLMAKEDYQGAHEYLQSQELDTDQKVAITALFSAGERRKLKEISSTRKAA